MIHNYREAILAEYKKHVREYYELGVEYKRLWKAKACPTAVLAVKAKRAAQLKVIDALATCLTDNDRSLLMEMRDKIFDDVYGTDYGTEDD